jgi:hypothetical protein
MIGRHQFALVHRHAGLALRDDAGGKSRITGSRP